MIREGKLPLRSVLRKDKTLTAAGWDENLQKAFDVCKQILVDRLHQTIFDPNDSSVTIFVCLQMPVTRIGQVF